MLAVELESFDLLKRIIDTCIENGIIADWFLHCSNAMRIAPPLVISDEEIIKACGIITNAMELHTNRL
jgi:4-aminobutyrate aminotransferase-like enzyme